jgi:hypothetical protein
VKSEEVFLDVKYVSICASKNWNRPGEGRNPATSEYGTGSDTKS